MTGTVSSPPKGWRSAVITDSKGAALATASNALVIAGNDPELRSTFARNVFTAEMVLTQPLPHAVSSIAPQPAGYPRMWTDSDIFLMQAYLHRFYSSKFSFEMAGRAMAAVAATQSFHPVLQWIESQTWDGTPRIDGWLVNTFNCADTPYIRAIGGKFLIAGIRRVRHPGCQHDTMLVIEGPQGIRKSTAFRTLFGDPWFTDDMPHDLKNKDSPQALLGKWGIEFSEVAQITSSKAEIETTKAFLSRRVDRFRPPYGRGFIEQPRQGVFVGTTNRTDWLVDETGNRRILPAYGDHADPEWVAVNRDQLWAEAAHREATGESIWLDTHDLQQSAAVEQERRMEDDPWAPAIRTYLASKFIPVEIGDVLSGIGVAVQHQDKRAQMRVGRVIRGMGWSRVTNWDANTQKMHKTWLPPNIPPP
jgi:predicted P-loop ATPase